MITDVQPTAFFLHLPLGDCSEFFSTPVLDIGFGQDVVSSAAISLHVSPHPGRRGLSLVPFAGLLGLGNRFPHVRELHLSSVIVNPATSWSDLVQQPRFSLLESLIIAHRSPQLRRESTVTSSLLDLFQHMPHLINLKIYSPTAYVLSAPTSSHVQYPELPFSLRQFICVSALPVPMCAHIISRSCNTLEELKVDLTGEDDVLLVSAIARAAPRLRDLDLGMRLRAESVRGTGIKSVFSALARLTRLWLETPQELEETLELLAGIRSVRELIIWRTYKDDQTSASASRVRTYIQRTPCLLCIILRGFNVGEEGRDALLEFCRARRVACAILD